MNIILSDHMNMGTGIPRTHVDLSDVEDFAGTDEASAEVHLHRGPKNIICLINND